MLEVKAKYTTVLNRVLVPNETGGLYEPNEPLLDPPLMCSKVGLFVCLCVGLPLFCNSLF